MEEFEEVFGTGERVEDDVVGVVGVGGLLGGFVVFILYSYVNVLPGWEEGGRRTYERSVRIFVGVARE